MTGHHRMSEQAIDAMKNLPPVGVAVLTFAGMPVEHWIQLLTVVWLLILIGGKLWGAWKIWSAKRQQQKRAKRKAYLLRINRKRNDDDTEQD